MKLANYDVNPVSAFHKPAAIRKSHPVGFALYRRAHLASLGFPEMRSGLAPVAILSYLGEYALPRFAFPLNAQQNSFDQNCRLAVDALTKGSLALLARKK